MNGELEVHGALRAAVTACRDELICLSGGDAGELCDDTDCTHCVLTNALGDSE